MALIQCPECGKEVSEQAPSCPDCGHPVAETIRARDKLVGFGVLVTGILAVVVIGSLIDLFQNTHAPRPADQSATTRAAPTPNTEKPKGFDIGTCFSSFTHHEMAVFDTLSSANGFLLVNLKSKADGKPFCRIQKKVLDILGDYLPDQRDEAFARFRDEMERR